MEMTITPAADKFIKRVMRFSGGPEYGFRMTIKSGGCSGLSAEFSAEAAPKEGESLVELGGIRFFLNAESRILLEGVTMDFVDSPTQTGFVFFDPKSSCGCSSKTLEAPAELAH